MLEGSVMEYVKWFVISVSLYFITITVMMMFQMNQMNSFQQEVNYQIERHGGLTDDAIDALNEHVKNVYGSRVVELDENGDIPADSTEKCGNPFYLKEYVINEDGTKHWYSRGETKAAFGTQIDYVIIRHIGSINGRPLIKPTIIGTSASRVRGD